MEVVSGADEELSWGTSDEVVELSEQAVTNKDSRSSPINDLIVSPRLLDLYTEARVQSNPPRGGSSSKKRTPQI